MSKKLAHEIASDYQRVAADLGRSPLRDEYLIHGAFSKHTIVSVFGGWTQFLRASGLQYNQGKRDKQAIRKEVFELLQKEADAIRVPQPPRLIKALLCISDMHLPYGHPDTVPFLLALNDKYRFDRVLCGGDEIDSHAMSFHDHDADLLSAGHELDAAIKALTPLYAAFPAVDVLTSNHGSMAYRKGLHHGIPRQLLKPYGQALNAPEGWQWQNEYVYQFTNGKKAVAHHGYSSNVLLASQQRAMSLIQFHFHSSFALHYWQNAEDLFFAMQCGCLVDDASLAMAYNKGTVKRPIIGCAGVLAGVPILFPMFLDSRKRWTGIVP